jgi:hypothetical protein
MEILPGVIVSDICLQTMPCQHYVTINNVPCEYPMDTRQIYKMIDDYNKEHGTNFPFGHFEYVKSILQN